MDKMHLSPVTPDLPPRRQPESRLADTRREEEPGGGTPTAAEPSPRADEPPFTRAVDPATAFAAQQALVSEGVSPALARHAIRIYRSAAPVPRVPPEPEAEPEEAPSFSP